MASVGDAVEAESQGCRSHNGQHVFVAQQSPTGRPKPSSASKSSLRDLGQLGHDLQRPGGAESPSSPGSPTTPKAGFLGDQYLSNRPGDAPFKVENFLTSSDRVAEEPNDGEGPRSSGDAD